MKQLMSVPDQHQTSITIQALNVILNSIKQNILKERHPGSTSKFLINLLSAIVRQSSKMAVELLYEP